MRQTSNQAPTNPPLRGAAERDHSQVIAVVMAIVEVQGDGGQRVFGAPVDTCGSPSAATLQSQHVRIQT
jgi:hypothetical protein